MASLPGRERDRWIVGKLGAYEAATVAQCDLELRRLLARLRDADSDDLRQKRPLLKMKIRKDTDALLDRRHVLTCSHCTS